MNPLPQIMFEITLEQQNEIENTCVQEGKSFQAYFLGLHKEHLENTRQYTKEEVEDAVRKAVATFQPNTAERQLEDAKRITNLVLKDNDYPEMFVKKELPKKKGRPKKEY
jgi:hypothetical protein